MSRSRLAIMAVAAVIIAICSSQSLMSAEAPPLPFHTIEGYGGGAITPMAYLVNPGPECRVFGKPSVAMTFGNLGEKQLSALTITETLYERIELGYGGDRLSLGNLPTDVQATTGLNINCGGHVWLHNFNTRVLVVKEGTDFGGLSLPAITAGAHVKVNNGISGINQCLGGALETIGYRNNVGVDFTLTATKSFAEIVGRPFFVTAGVRGSKASQLGFLGFGDKYRATFEGNVVYMPFDRLVLAYEFRQKTNPYGTIASSTPGEFLIGDENNWHAIDAAYILNNQTTLCVGWGNFGNLANAQANGSWCMQLKYEF